MKTTLEILTDIATKIAEHKKQVECASDDLDYLKKSGKAGIESAMKQLVLKDKILFHKAAYMTLDDLKESING